MGRHVKKGDLVEVISGRFKGRQGKILEVLVEADRVRVEGVAPIIRHLKPGKDAKLPDGGRIQRVGSVHISNVMVVEPQTGKRTRTYRKILEDGSKVRIAKSNSVQLD